MRNKILLIASIICAMTAKSVYADPSFAINNTTSFYLFNKDRAAGCPEVVAPGQLGTSSAAWCGFVACATKDFDADKGCLENNNDYSALVEGGYATWFSISFGNHVATVPDGNIYQASYDANGKFILDYKNITQKYSAGPNAGQPVTLAKVMSYSTGPALRGVNVSGLEYDGTFLDAMYQHPDLPDIRYFVQQGMNTVRLPIRWEFVLGTKGNFVESHDPMSTTVNTMYLNSVYDTLEKYLASGVTVIVDLHNYMRFCPTGAAIGQANEPTDAVKNNCQIVTSDQLAYVWDILANKFADLGKKYPNQLIFELMNEPFADFSNQNQILNSADLLAAEVAAVKAIRSHGLDNLILLSGNYWDPFHGWVDQSPQPGAVVNGDVFTAEKLTAAGINDLSHIGIDMHQYLDQDYSGRSEVCQTYSSYQDFKEKMHFNVNGVDIFGNWVKANNMKVFLGEFGAADNETCRQDMGYLLQYVNEHAYDATKPNDGGFIGWTAWRANRHGDQGFSNFNFLQAADGTVYGATGQPGNGLGIVQGHGNGLMDDFFANYLTKSGAK